MTSSNEKIEPGFYWVRERGRSLEWTVGEVKVPAIREVYLVGIGPDGFPVEDFEFGSRVEPPGTDYYVTSIDGDTIRLGSEPPPASSVAPAATSPALVTGDGPFVGRVSDLLPAALCRGCGRTDCPAPTARAAYDVAKAALEAAQDEDCRRRGSFADALPVMPLRERYALDDAERDCKAAHAAAWDRYLAERTASPPASASRLVAVMRSRPDKLELVAEAALHVLDAVLAVVGETPSAAEADRVLQAAAGLAVTIDAIGGR